MKQILLNFIVLGKKVEFYCVIGLKGSSRWGNLEEKSLSLQNEA
jgi:hypothetical protein